MCPYCRRSDQASQQTGAASPRFVARPTARPYVVYAQHRRCATTSHDVCQCTRRSTQRQKVVPENKTTTFDCHLKRSQGCRRAALRTQCPRDVPIRGRSVSVCPAGRPSIQQSDVTTGNQQRSLWANATIEVRSADRAFPFLADDPPLQPDFAGFAPVFVDRWQVLNRQRLLRIGKHDLGLAQLDRNSRKRLYIRSHE